MSLYPNRERLVIFDADGTTVDAFHAVEQSFLRHGMDLGDQGRFRRRRKLFKYLGGLREFPVNLRRQFGPQSRRKLLGTLTEFYRHEARLYPGIAELLQRLLAAPDIRVGLVTRNVTLEPQHTLKLLFARHGIDTDAFDYFSCIALGEDKTLEFKHAREYYGINPARSYACGDEYGDYRAALGAGMYPFVVAYGVEDQARLSERYAVPGEFIASSPEDFTRRLLHTLDLETAPAR
jgi:phosphoglycolate phosphatase